MLICVSLQLISLGWLLFAGWHLGPDSLKQLPGKLEVLKENFLEMRVEATGLKGLGLEGPFFGWERVYFKPL